MLKNDFTFLQRGGGENPGPLVYFQEEEKKKKIGNQLLKSINIKDWFALQNKLCKGHKK